MLTDDEKQYLIERLTSHVAVDNTPRATLAAPFVGTGFPAALGEGNPRQLVLQSVQLCLADAWTNDPPWLVRLIEIMPVDVVDAKLAQVRDRLRVKPPAPPNRIDATVLDNGTPFVNRTLLRGHLRRLATPAASLQPILVVSGAVQSGKSYSTEYIDHFAVQHAPPTLTCRVPLRPGTELETGPEEVAIDLVRSMGRTLQDKPLPNTNQKLLAQQLASWVLNEAVQTSNQCWLVLDNFQGSKLRADTRDFVIALADRVTTGVFREKCRLILIGFDRAVLAVDPGRVGEERIMGVPQAEIEACVAEIARRAPVPMAVGPLVAFASMGLPNGEQRLREMNARLRALILTIDRVREIRAAIPDLDFAEVIREMLLDLPFGERLMPELETRLEALRASAAEMVP